MIGQYASIQDNNSCFQDMKANADATYDMELAASQ